jgi:hypothetical protein
VTGKFRNITKKGSGFFYTGGNTVTLKNILKPSRTSGIHRG